MTTDTSGTAPERPTGAENETAPSPAAGGPPEPSAAGEQEVVAKELAEAKDRLLRTLAEMENLRRRTEREVVDARLYGIANFARDMLGIADNIHRALEAISPEIRDAAEGGVKALIEGVELTERELHKTLEKYSVRRFDPTGEKFDPNLHQAMYEIPDPATPAGMVAQVVQAGYMIGERVLRPALVGVSKGGPKTAPQTESAPGAQS